MAHDSKLQFTTEGNSRQRKVRAIGPITCTVKTRKQQINVHIHDLSLLLPSHSVQGLVHEMMSPTFSGSSHLNQPNEENPSRASPQDNLIETPILGDSRLSQIDN